MKTPPSAKQRQRWTLFCALALIYILVYFYRVSLAVVADDLSRELALTPQQLGTLSGILFYVYAAAQLPLGPLIDRFGGRLVICCCGILTTLGGILFSQAHTLAVAMLARVLIGVGTAAVLMATFAIFSHWYSRQEFGRVSGLMVAVGNLGNLAGTAPLAIAVAAAGWRGTFFAIGVAQAVATVLVFLLVRDHPPQCAGSSDLPAVESQEGGSLFGPWREIFSNRDFLWLAGVAFFWYGCYLAVQGLWGGPYLMGVFHFSRELTGKLLMFTSIGFIFGSFFSDRVARRLGSHKRTLVAGQGILVVLMTAFLGWAEFLSPSLLAGLFFALGVAVSSGVMIYPIIRAIFPVRIVGTALTSLNFFVLLGAATTQHLMGVIIGRRTSVGATPDAAAYHLAFLLPIVGLAVALVLFAPLARDYTAGDGRSG